jgi:hypothetical protein
MMQAASPGSRRAVLRRSEKTRFIVCERRRSRRVHSAIRAERSEPLEHGNRAPPHGGEASGGVPLRATTTAADSRCSRRRSAGGDGGTTLFRSVSSDEDGGNRANIAASEASNKYSAMREQLQKMRCLLLGVAGKKLSEHLTERRSGVQLREDCQPTQPDTMDEQIAGWEVELHCDPA